VDNPFGTKSFSAEACRFLESSQNSYLNLWKRKWVWVRGDMVMRKGGAAGVKTIREVE
jgi:hypothetical protein